MFKLQNHITGKVYDLTQENMCAMLDAIDRQQEAFEIVKECAELLALRDWSAISGKEDGLEFYEEQTEKSEAILNGTKDGE